jgi:hypothetical protein
LLTLLTETCSKLYIVEYIVVFWLNDVLVNSDGLQPWQPGVNWELVPSIVRTELKYIIIVIIMYMICTFEDETITLPLNLRLQLISDTVQHYREKES